MSRNSRNESENFENEVVEIIDASPEGQEMDYDKSLSDKEAKREVSRLNNEMVKSLKSEIKTVIIALNRVVTLAEIVEFCEFMADTRVDVKLVKRAIRQMVKDETLTQIDSKSWQMSQHKRQLYDVFASIRAQRHNPTQQ